jgi:hypothetical protein
MADARTTSRTGSTMTGWARTADYLFGRNALIGLASLMLLLISGYATWHGMRDFILGVSTSSANVGQELPGGLSVSNDFLVIAVVIALTFLMWLALRETFGAQRRLTERMITFPLYLFLAIWSIGFGYGFWWSLIAGEETTRTSLQNLQEDARDAAAAVAARLDAVRGQLDNVVIWSDSQMTREEGTGGSCGTPSGAGRGPLYNARRSVRDSVSSLRDSMTNTWITPIQTELERLRQSVTGLDGANIEERRQRFETTASDIRGNARSIAARSNELGRATAAQMRALANLVSAQPNQAGFYCYDPTLGQRLRQAADQADQAVNLNLREARFSEGAAGVANAIKNLWNNIGTYASSLASYVISGGTETGKRTASGDPVTGRDLIALLATIGIDLGLLALVALNPPAAGPVRRDALAPAQARLHLLTPQVVQQLASAIETAVARAPGVNLEWVRRHFIHHGGASYFVIPNLYSVDQADKNEEERALAMNHLAGVFDDLELVRVLSKHELKRFGREEMRDSYTDLTPFRQERNAEEAAKGPPKLWTRWFAATSWPPKGGGPHVRNHGLLSKSQRALDIAGWSAAAQRDVEIFRLVDSEGLTPLLTLLNEATLAKGAESVEKGRKEQELIQAGKPLQIEHKPEG